MGRGVDMMNEFTSRTGKYYDLVIRMRPDLYFNEALPSFSSDTFYTIRQPNHVNLGTGDTFQASNQWFITLFGAISTVLPSLYKTSGILCPHILSEGMIKTLNIPWKEFDIKRTLMHTPVGEYVSKQFYGY